MSLHVIWTWWRVFVAVALKDSGIDRPRDLDGKKYASYGARYEGRIVQRLIQTDGGKGDFEELTPEKLGIWNTLIAGAAEATWIFKGWEGIIAKLEGVGLNQFTLRDYGYTQYLLGWQILLQLAMA